MQEKLELYKHIYQDAEMACYTIDVLQKDLKDRDNKIKSLLEQIYKDYQTYLTKSKKEIKKNNEKLEPNGLMSKIMSNMGIKKEVINDNSDSAIADLMIQGVSMGSISMEKKIKDYENEVNSNELEFAKKFLKFQQDTIEKLKEYL